MYTALLVTASVVCAVVLDHHGALGFAQRNAMTGRLVGAALTVVGVVLVSTL